jgi:hypothetical protein
MLQMADTTEDTYQSEFSFMQLGHTQQDFLFAQTATGQSIIPHTWILLDSQSTVSVFKNRDLLTNIWPSTQTLCVHTNGSTQTSIEMGHVKNFGNVWFNANSLAILSMAEVRKVCQITMDTSVKASMNVHRRMAQS